MRLTMMTMIGRFRVTGITGVTMVVFSCCALAQVAADATASAFAPLDQWKTAILAGDATALSNLYSTTPALQVAAEKGAASDAAAETNFWVGLKARKIDLQIVQKTSPQPGVPGCRLSGRSAIWQRNALRDGSAGLAATGRLMATGRGQAQPASASAATTERR